MAIVNVGMVDTNGIELAHAALTMSELQRPELNENGEPTGERVPLVGADLLAAAHAWAAAAGLIVVDDEGTVASTPAAPSTDEQPDAPQTGTGDLAAASIDPNAAALAPADPGAVAPLEA